MYRIVRQTGDFDLVIVVSSPDGDPKSPEAKFYRYTSWPSAGGEGRVFREISREAFEASFAGVTKKEMDTRPVFEFSDINELLGFVRERGAEGEQHAY